MRHWTGVVLMLGAAWLVVSAVRHRARVLAIIAAAKASGETVRPLHPSLSVLADIAPGIVLFGLVAVGAEIAFTFLLTDGGGLFSLVDLAGFLLLLAAYGFWFVIRTRYRPDRPDG